MANTMAKKIRWENCMKIFQGWKLCIIFALIKLNTRYSIFRKHPQLHDEEYAIQRFGKSASMAPFVLPAVINNFINLKLLWNFFRFKENHVA
jgi:hypothetical protein